MVAVFGTPVRIGLVGAPTDVGAFKNGAADGPAALRAAGLVDRLAAAGAQVEDWGDVAGPAYTGQVDLANCRSLGATVSWCRAVRSACTLAFDSDRLPLLVGGDHSVALGSVAAAAAHARAQGKLLHVLWFDAHPDFNTHETTGSGNTHGQPAAAFCGLGHPALRAVAGEGPAVNPANLTQFGIRSVDEGEARNLARAGVTVHDMGAVQARGLVPLVSEALDRALAARALVHVSFDLDFLDPAEAPGVGTPVEGGVALDDALAALALLSHAGVVASLDLVEFAPRLDVGDRTLTAALTLLETVIAPDRVQASRPRLACAA